MIDQIAGFLTAALAGMGVGGGGLLVLYLVFAGGMEQREAQGINLLFFIFSAAFSLLYHARKRKINVRLSLILTVSGAAGAIAGAFGAHVFDPETVRKAFGWLLVVSGILSLLKKSGGKDGEKIEKSLDRKKSL